MQNQNNISSKKCELCSMNATHSEKDTSSVEHYFCEHHNLKDLSENKKNEKESINYKITKPSKSLKPIFYVFIGITLASLLRQIYDLNFMTWMMDFMGVFFMIFGLFKLYDLKGFVDGFKTYDIVAKKFPVFGYAFPFIEIILGFMYLVGFMFFYQNLVALVLSALGIYSAYIAIKNKVEVQCVCLGTVFNLPMTNVTLIENGVMFTMAFFMLIM